MALGGSGKNKVKIRVSININKPIKLNIVSI